jgi:uncharacterized RDD family membrane protein YckC/cytoskeletal protein CcmA (bactofilin family)
MKLASIFPPRFLAPLLASLAVACAQPAQPASPDPGAQPPAAAPAPPAEPALRRLDDPAADAAPAGTKSPAPQQQRRPRTTTRDEVPFGSQTVPAGNTVHDAVAIFGSVEVEGVVKGDAVAVRGDVRVAPAGRIEGDAVAVLGRVLMAGAAGKDIVSVLGGVEIDGPVGGEVISVLGPLKLGPNAIVERDVIVVAGKLMRDEGAVIKGSVQHISVPGLDDFEWLFTWLRECAMLGRPLGFHGQLGWAWAIAFGFLGFYLLLALLFGRGVTLCAATFERRPAMSILAALLTVMLSPVVIVILALTIIGGLLVPFVGAALFFAGLFGKVVMLAWLGRRFTKFFGDGPLGGPVFATLLGGLVVLLIYTIPFVGFTAYKLVSWLGLGAVMLTIVEAMQRNKRPPAAAAAAAGPAPMPPPSPSVPSAPAPVPAAPLAVLEAPAVTAPLPPPPAPLDPPAASPAAAGFIASPPPAYAPRDAAPAPVPPPAPRAPALDETALPRANLLLRLAALALDGVLIGVLLGFLGSIVPRFLHFHDGPGGFLLVLAIYAAVMWTLRGTTIGGVVCGLKVVRRDGRALDGTTAFVRALGCFLSLVVAGLGFIWIAFDEEQQAWHDKIAGTIVVRMPKGTSLV